MLFYLFIIMRAFFKKKKKSKIKEVGYFFGQGLFAPFLCEIFNTQQWCRAKKVHPLHLWCLVHYLKHNRTMADNRAFLPANNAVTMTTSRRTFGQEKLGAWRTSLIKKWNKMTTITLMSEREATDAFRHLWHCWLDAFSIIFLFCFV